MISQRSNYKCRCGREVDDDYLAMWPVPMAYDLASARQCFQCYGRDLETSMIGGDTDEETRGGGGGVRASGSFGRDGEGTGNLGDGGVAA